MIRRAEEKDVKEMLDILNYYIVNSTAIYMYEAQSYEERLAWYRMKMEKGEPIFVYELEGKVVGYSTYGTFRPYPAYQYTVEQSVYVHRDYHGKGIGSELMQTIIEEAIKRGKKTIIAGINTTNEASIKAHTKMGFTYSGTIRNAGYKFDNWLDLAFYQLDLPDQIKK